MKIGGIFNILFITLLVLLNSVIISALRINEVELNPPGTDKGNEWVELYSDSPMSLDGFRLINHDNKEINLSGNLSGYGVISFKSQWLDNSNESIKLIQDDNIIDQTPVLKDSSNDNKTWQFCSEWEFKESTKGTENNCQASDISTNNETSGSDINNPTEDYMLESGKTDAPIVNKTSETNNEKISIEIISNKTDTSGKIIPKQDTVVLTPIKLGQNVNSKKGIKTYKSRTEYIKEYSPYGFTLFLSILLIILIKWQKKLESYS
jgi:hypothetical protein